MTKRQIQHNQDRYGGIIVAFQYTSLIQNETIIIPADIYFFTEPVL